jgi:methionyl-tRNA synthetase
LKYKELVLAKFYITTPIYYTNDVPHIGHAYSTIAADVIARYHRQQKQEVLFSTGVDENSQKVVKSAEAAKKDMQAYVDEMAAAWQKVFDQLEISYDRFVRTTEPAHKTAVYEVLKRIEAAGDLYPGEYEGLYCASCEEFKKESDLVEGKCPLHGSAPEKLKEKNYFFKLSRYQAPLLDHIKQNPDFIQPVSRRNEVVAFIERGLEDFSVTRETQKWGIPYPFDETQVLYVWVEALMNYLTVAGYPAAGYEKWWPADVHVMGKDIVRFHAVYWPALLMSAKLPLPKRVVAHGFLNIEGAKISKSRGNVVDPLALASEYGNDALRYLLLRYTPFGQDGDFSLKQIQVQYDADLANDLGNLVQRTAKMVSQYQAGVVGKLPPHSHDIKLYRDSMEAYRFDKALEEVWAFIRGLNQYIEEEKPWEVAKSQDTEHLGEVLAYLVANILQIALLLEPFMPDTAAKIAATFADGLAHPEVGMLFPKKESAAK